jgi:hypothetical protein
MPRLPATSQIAYNGFVFPAQSHWSITQQEIPDISGRTVTKRKYTLTVQAILTSEVMAFDAGSAPTASLDMSAYIPALRTRLSTYGSYLVLNQVGFGNMTITSDTTLNTPAAGTTLVYDIDFGPKPHIETLEPVGDNKALQLIWSCSFTLIDCQGDPTGASPGPFGEFAFGVVWSLDERRLTTRTIRGQLQIRVARNGRRITATAEAARDVLSFPVPGGFKRSDNYQVSEDRKLMNFVIVDKEIDSEFAYPDGVENIQADQEISPVNPQGSLTSKGSAPSIAPLHSPGEYDDQKAYPTTRWVTSLSVVIRMYPNQSRGLPWQIFQMVAAGRLGFIGQTNFVTKPIIRSLRVRESIYARQFSFQLAIEFSTTYSQFLVTSRMFIDPGIAGSAGTGWSWPRWVNSIKSVIGPRGFAGLVDNTNDSPIVDFCRSDTSNIGTVQVPPLPNPARVTTLPVSFAPTSPPEKSSWTLFENSIECSADTQAVSVTVPGTQDDTKPPTIDLNGKSFQLSTPTGGSTAVAGQTFAHVYSRGPSPIYLVMRGRALRIGYPCPIPKIKTVGDGSYEPHLLRWSLVPSKRVGTIGGIAVYGSAWYYLYDISDIPNRGNLSVQFDTKTVPPGHTALVQVPEN